MSMDNGVQRPTRAPGPTTITGAAPTEPQPAALTQTPRREPPALTRVDGATIRIRDRRKRTPRGRSTHRATYPGMSHVARRTIMTPGITQDPVAHRRLARAADQRRYRARLAATYTAGKNPAISIAPQWYELFKNNDDECFHR